jgi:hypothetical protein
VTFLIEKYEDFSSNLVLMGGLLMLKFLKSEKLSRVFSIFSHFKVAFLLTDIGDFSHEFLQNILFNV